MKRDIGDSVALCQCVAQELGHAELSMNSEVYSRRDMGFQAVCIGYMLCRKYGVDTQNFAIDRIPDELKTKSRRTSKPNSARRRRHLRKLPPVFLTSCTASGRSAQRNRRDNRR